ncbi:cell division initiation protein [Streptomyces sp. H27-C3]|uniref:ATP synthase F0 subunit B n=1 Tax=Streptomyces sp. H27-C3 TaxID=3046305 RepID=UPI0024BB5269|nr:cell division initiation protein [Streptomyces sp. H27-C3]MDJ0460882.1 cell division initiation protein [Streptomyces sp. H27-C3]
MDVQKKLDEIVEAIGSARSMPMSASCVVNRADLLSMLEEVRDALPGSLAQAQELIGGREQLAEQARQEAERIIESAHAQRGSLISDTEVALRSQDEADRILTDARREADEIRVEADEYVDSKLANFEVVLTKTLGSVDRGREKLLGRGPGLDEQGYPDEEAPERSHDPETLRQRADEYVDTKIGAFQAVLSKTLEAVGRGRQKLHGQVASDELGLHMAAQDDAGPQHSSDSDFLADLAEPQAAHAVPQQAHAPAPPREQPQVPAQQPYDPYGYQQQPQDPYAYQRQPQDPYAYQQQDPYAYQQQGYDQVYEQQGYGQQGYEQPQAAEHQQPQQPRSSLDETSLFDTSVINLDQLREYDQGR